MILQISHSYNPESAPKRDVKFQPTNQPTNQSEVEYLLISDFPF